MNPLVTIVGYFISLPARIKGMKFGRGSLIAPGYDWLFEQLKNIKIGSDCHIGKNAWIHTVDQGQITIGNETDIGRNVTIGARNKITIGSNILFSFGVTVLDHDHEFRDLDIPPVKNKLTLGREIVIEDDCFVGAHSFIFKGVHLGKHVVVGANSVVTKSFPAFSVIAGNPAKFIKSIKNPK
jgi:lipopolysaccharide O-acetyltransferase